ncbi:MAG: tetratricopeptide repeat protein, partial [Candidatus Brocadiia bacterium]
TGGRIFPFWVLATLAGAAAAPVLGTGALGAMAAAAGAAAVGLFSLSYVGAPAAAAGLCLLAVLLACRSGDGKTGAAGRLAAVLTAAAASVVLLLVSPHAGWRPLREQLGRGRALSEDEAASLRLERAELAGRGAVVSFGSTDAEVACIDGDLIHLRRTRQEASGAALRLLTVLPAAYAREARTVGLVAPALEETRRGAALLWGRKAVHTVRWPWGGGHSESDIIIAGPGALSGAQNPIRILSVEALRGLRRRLAPGGALALYLPAGWLPPATLQRALCTFAEVFPQFDLHLAREEAILIGHVARELDYGALRTAFAGQDARRWLREGGLWEPMEALLAFVASGEELRGFLDGAEPFSQRAPARPSALGRDLSASPVPVSLAALAQHRLAGPRRIGERLRTQDRTERAVALRGFASVYEATTRSTLEAIGRTGAQNRERLVEFLRGPLARLDLLAPGQAELPVRLAAAMTALGMRERAVDSLKQAASAGQDSYAVRMRLVEALADAQEMEQALEHCRRALELRPDSVEALRRMAALLLATGRPDPAGEALERVIRQAPDSVTDILMLAKLRTRAGELEAAADLARRALQIEPGNPDAQFLLEVLSGETGPETPSGGAP